MNNKHELIEQTSLAFDFIQKLYLEVSYLIKQLEAILNEEEEKFVIGKPGGYSVTARSSTGLDASNVSLWLYKKMAVFFVSSEFTDTQKGTPFQEKLKVLYMRIVLKDKDAIEPAVYFGVLYGIKNKGTSKSITKFENLMGTFEYNNRIINNQTNIDYDDYYIGLKGELLKYNLFDINDSEAIYKQLVKPSLELYRKY